MQFKLQEILISAFHQYQLSHTRLQRLYRRGLWNCDSTGVNELSTSSWRN
jgi:hypothetical protein